MEHERERADSIEVEFKSLKIKYEDVCERIHAATHQLEHVQIVLEQTSRRCEQLEKEKVKKTRYCYFSFIFISVMLFFYDSTSLAAEKIGINIYFYILFIPYSD